jgi:hypothetical protein
MLDDWRSSGFERVDSFALLLRHIGPPVIVAAEHVRLHIVGSRPLRCKRRVGGKGCNHRTATGVAPWVRIDASRTGLSRSGGFGPIS